MGSKRSAILNYVPFLLFCTPCILKNLDISSWKQDLVVSQKSMVRANWNFSYMMSVSACNHLYVGNRDFFFFFLHASQGKEQFQQSQKPSASYGQFYLHTCHRGASWLLQWPLADAWSLPRVFWIKFFSMDMHTMLRSSSKYSFPHSATSPVRKEERLSLHGASR